MSGAPPRLYVALALENGRVLALPPGAARHAQVLRLQPGDPVVLYNGAGGEWRATIAHMARAAVDAEVGEHVDVDRELPVAVELAFGMPANERMDGLVEKATELGAAALQPLVCERSVLRVEGERAEKKRAHWQAVATAASEQCGRTRVPAVRRVTGVADWLASIGDPLAPRFLLSLSAGARPLGAALGDGGWTGCVFLSGPEGGLAPGEERSAIASGFRPVALGSRVLRADTAPIAAMAAMALVCDAAFPARSRADTRCA